MTGLSLDALTGWDWFVLVVFLLSISLGIWRGLVRTVFGLAAWVVALIGAPLFAPPVVEATRMEAHPWVVIVLLFVAILVAVKLLGGLVARLLGKVGLGGADRGLGGALGAARALLLILLAAVAARMLEMDQTSAWRNALSRPLLEALVQWVEPHLPQRQGNFRQT
jgi:membrane protein required for colicin V production